MAKKAFSIHVGEGVERLVGDGEDRKLITLREIKVFEGSKEINKFDSADNEADTDEQVKKRGYIVDSKNGSVWTAHERPMNGTERGMVGCFIAFAVVFLLIIGGCVAIMSGDGKRGEADEGDAIYACKDFTKDKLKSPSSAKFSDETASGSGSSWTSSGTVDSQNSFGAMVRSGYTCTLTYTESTETWRGTATLLE